MKKALKTLISTAAIFIALCLIFTVTACGGSKVTSIELSDSSISLYIGDTYSLDYIVYPQSAADETGTWEAFPDTIATVDDNGTVTALAEGSAVVRITIGDVYDQCTVKVTDKSKEAVNETGVSLDRNSISFDDNTSDPVQLTATVTPSNATDPSVTWTSGDTDIATVDQTGLVTPVGGGTTTITVRTNNLGYNASCAVSVGGEAAKSTFSIPQVESLEGRQKTDDEDTDYFIMGMDASEVPSVEAARKSVEDPENEDENYSPYKNFDGEEEDVFQILKDNGITDIRVRIWNNPSTSTTEGSTGSSYGGGNCDVDNAVEIAERCEAVGLGMIVDFHYSDFWADPGKQTVPKAWDGKSVSDVATAIGDFTEESLEAIQNTGVTITMVQIGNETNGFMCGSSDWSTICSYMNAGASAVRSVTGTLDEGGAKVALHFTNGGKNVWEGYAKTLKSNNVDYDVFGVSWYPYYESHGTLSNATKQLESIHTTYGKDVMVLETAYAYAYDDFDGTGNTALETTTQPITVQGQSNAVRDVIQGIADLKDSDGYYYGLGICYWGGTWIGASSSSDGSTNRALCTTYGCGWASAAAYPYDTDAQYIATGSAGGTQVDNQTFFDQYGDPLESLHVFSYVFESGHEADLAVDYADDVELFYTVDEGPIELPTTATVYLNNGNQTTTTVSWFAEQSELEEMIHNVNTYYITGTTAYGGQSITCVVWVQYPNLLSNGSFEDSTGYADGTTGVKQDVTDWTIGGYTSTSDLQLYVSSNSSNARIGSQSFHFWDSLDMAFYLEQTVDLSALSEFGSGYYGASFEVQGGDVGDNTKVYAYVKVTDNSGNTTTYSVANGNDGDYATLTSWQNWSRTYVSGVEIDLTNVKSIVVGIYVYATAADGSSGPWGNIDNCQFYFEGTKS